MRLIQVIAFMLVALPSARAARRPPPGADTAALDAGTPRPSVLEEALAGPCDPALTAILADVLARSPEIAQARARAAAAAQVPAQARSLADPMVQLMTTSDADASWGRSTDLLVMASQAVPAPGKRRLMGEAAEAEAEAAAASVDRARLAAVNEARRWYHELAYLDAAEALRRTERDAIHDFVSIARSRYETGSGLQSDVMKTATEVTRVEVDLVGLRGQRRVALSTLNSLRDRPADTPVTTSGLPRVSEASVELASLRHAAAHRRPELTESSAMVAAAEARARVARLAAKPELTLGGFYEAMDLGTSEGDADEAGFVVGMSLPLRRGRIAAGVEQAVQLRLAAAEGSRLTAAAVEREIGVGMARLDAASRQARLHDDVLTIQAEESVRSLLHAYTTGTASALDVLDALRIDYEVRLLALRSRADYLQALSSLAAATGSHVLGQPACDPAPEAAAPARRVEEVAASVNVPEPPKRRPALGR